MFGVAQFKRAIASLGARVDQFFGFEHIAAVIALIGAGTLEAADVTGAFHVTVRQEFVCTGRIPLLTELLEEKAVLLQRQEHALRDLEVILGVRGGEQVIRNAIALEQLDETIVIFFIDFFDGLAFLIRRDRDRCAVRIGARDHQHVDRLSSGGNGRQCHQAGANR